MDKGKITSLQMAILLYPVIVATAILGAPATTSKFAKTDFWMSPILASVLGFVAVYIAYQLHKLYPKHNLIQYSEKILGKVPGKLLGFIFAFFYIQCTGLVAREYAEFVVDSFLVRTPIKVIMGSMVLLSAFAIRGGVEILGRSAQVFLPLFVFPLLLLVILVAQDYDFGNLLPILGNGILPPIEGAIVPSSWYTEFLLIAFLLPYISDLNKSLKYGMMTVCAVMLTLVIVNLVVLLIIGSSTSSKVYPLMSIARYISIGNFFEHLESVVMAVWVVGAFIKISMFYYAAALCTAYCFKLSDYRPIVFPLGFFVVAFSIWSIPSSMELERFLIGTLPIYFFVVQIIIPLILWGIAVIKQKKPAS